MAYSYVWNIKQQWLQQQANTWSRGDRGLFLGGGAPTGNNVIDFINISSVGNATDFGDLANAGTGVVASNSIRASRLNGNNNSIDYITMSTSGNAADFGDRLTVVYDTSAANDTRGLYAGGYAVPNFSPGWNNPTIEFLTFATLGNCTDFGDLTQGRSNQTSGANPTRGIFAGGYNGSPGFTNVTDYVTMASAGNALDFGDLVGTTWAALPANSDTRLYCAGGQPGSDVISYFTFSTLGNSVDWGDLSVKGSQGSGSSNNVRGIFGMGEAASPLTSNSNVLEFVSLVSAGNSADFGDLTVGRQDNYGIASQGHGGIILGGEPRIGDTVLGTQVYFSGDRGIFNGGESGPAATAVTDYIEISQLGNAVDFGDLARANAGGGANANSTRYVTNGDFNADLNTYYIQFSTKGNFAFFGDLTVQKYLGGTGGNETRGINYSGVTAPGITPTNVIDFLTFATLGNCTDFGDALVASYFAGGTSSPTRVVKAGGISSAPATYTNVMEYITIASTGNGTDFGDLLAAISGATSGVISNGIRGIFGGGGFPVTNVIQYITIASAGDSIDFGDLTNGRFTPGGASSKTRGVFAGGENPAQVNIMDYVTIASEGNATDFGDLTISVSRHGGNSNGHGGLN